MSASSQESRICDIGKKMDILLHEGQHWFRAANVTSHLGYANGRQAVINFVKKKDRAAKKDLMEGSESSIYINETGLRALIRRSRKPEAEDLEAWVALKMDELRGSSARRPRNRMQIQLLNETDLHYKTVDFIRKYYPQAIIVPGLGELQRTEQDRLDAWAKGYKSGICDLLLLNPNDHNNGLALELKTPAGTGVVSQNQQAFLEKLEAVGFKTLISNDYDQICQEIRDYFS